MYATDKEFIFQQMNTFQLTGSKRFDTQTVVFTEIQDNGVSLAQDLQKHLYNESRKLFIIYRGKHKKMVK